MKNRFSMSAVLTAVAISACSTTKQQAVGPAVPSPVTVAARQRTVQTTEVASGDVREALLVLSRVHFALDSHTLLPETRKALTQAADRLRAYPDVHVYIDGHSDERGTSEYNMALGDRRANTVKNFLVQMGVAGERLHVVSHGMEQPLASGHDVLSYAQNRRAEFRLMRGAVRLILEEGILFDDTGHPIVPAQAASLAAPNRRSWLAGQ